MSLNRQAANLVERVVESRESLRVEIIEGPGGCRLIDLGIRAAGGLDAGRKLAEICLSGLAHVSVVPSPPDIWHGPAVAVVTDAPVLACMASQYAGWQLASGKFFAMGSGPMRAAAAKEPLFADIEYREQPGVAVGVLETRRLPPEEVCQKIAAETHVDLKNISLLLAPTASQAGTFQIVARSIETALHKMHELGLDLKRVVSGFGVAPLPPVAANDLAAIGRTNDAILYGADVTLWLVGDDASLEELGPRIPSSASADYGERFSEIFERYERQFYRIDPHLFSPAVITLVNVETGRAYRFGQVQPDIIEQSFLN